MPVRYFILLLLVGGEIPLYSQVSVQDSLPASCHLMYLTLTAAAVLLLLLIWFLRKARIKNRIITEQHRRLDASNKGLEQQHQSLQQFLLEKKNLVSLLTHDLRSPIASIRFNTQSLKDHPATPPDLQAILSDIASSSGRVNELLRRIIQVENWEDEQPFDNQGMINICHVLEKSIDEYRIPARQKKIAFEMEDKASTCLIWGDEFILRHIFGNVLSNAVKFNPPGVPVKILVESTDSSVRIKITDRGPGIEPADQEKIFEKYFRGNYAPPDQEESLGLGLYLTKKYVEQHHGQIQAESDAGGGTSIVCIFPVYSGLE
jgi:signal transduction histidine kinase